MLTERAPAKLNLTLEVLGKRPDGFHEIRSMVQTIDLADFLTFEDTADVSINCDLPGWSAQESLVMKAIKLMSGFTSSFQGVSIKIEKHIPLLSGLGGDSSDAAAVLRGLNRLWGLDLSMEKLSESASRLGSDVSFLLQGGTALMEGRGEIVTLLPPPPKAWLVLVVPDVGRQAGKTGRMYAALKPEHFTDGGITERAVTALQRGEFSAEMLFNAFENIAFDEFNIRRVYVEHLLKMGAPHVHLAGSGPALFGMFNDKAKAEDLYRSCQDQGMNAYMGRTM